MAHFHGLCHGNCNLMHIRGILELIKIDFRGHKGQFDVKNANFMGQIAKNGYLWTNLAHRYPPMAHFHGLCNRNCNLRHIRGILELIKIDFRGLKGQTNVKKANFRVY